MIAWRTLFVVFLIFTILFFARMGSNIVIDTNLRDLSPDSALDQETQIAIDKLAENIQRRLLFLISGENPKQVKQAADDFAASLSSEDTLSLVSGENNVQEVLTSLSKYRFQLLTKQQQQQLENPDTHTIAEQAHRSLFRLTHTPLLPFDEDPLGWHGEYFSTLLKQITRDLGQSANQFKDSSGQVIHYQIVQAILNEGGLSYQTQHALSAQISELSQQVSRDYQVDVKSSGVFFFAVEAATKSKQDITLISTISTVGIFILLLVTFRSFWPIILPFVSIVLGVSFAFAVSHFLYAKVHVLTIVFGASLIGIVIDYSIHYFFHYSEANSAATQDAAASTKKLHSALLLSLVTSLLGYSALYFSDLDALKKVALFSCCGLLMAWLSVMCLGSYASKKIITHDAVILKVLSILTFPLRIFTVRFTQVVVVCVLLAVAFVLPILSTDDDPRLFFRPDAALLANETAVSNRTSDFEPGRYVIIRADSVDKLYANTQAFFQKVELASGLKQENFRSITQWLASPSEQQKNYQLQGGLYEPSGAVEPFYKLLGMKENPTAKQQATEIREAYQESKGLILEVDQLNQLLSDVLPPLWNKLGTTYVSLVLITKGIDFNELQHLTDSLDQVDYFNTVASATQSLKQQRISASQLLGVAYLLIALLIFLRYRKIQSLKILLIPLCSTAILILVLFLAGAVFNLFHVMALFLVLGLGMDYGIFSYEMRRGTVTEQAIFISAITSLLSFGLLALSSIFVAQSFGLILFLGNILNLTGALIYKNHLSRPLQVSL